VSKSQRDKGLRIEREIVEAHREIGVHAERVPLSGAAHYKDDGHDVDIYPWGKDEAPLVAEIKGRGKGAGFKLLERWLGEHDLLFLRRDRQEPLVVVPWHVWERLICRATRRLPSTLPECSNGHPGETFVKPDTVAGTSEGREP
jgi:Holliday junction resolvase